MSDEDDIILSELDDDELGVPVGPVQYADLLNLLLDKACDSKLVVLHRLGLVSVPKLLIVTYSDFPRLDPITNMQFSWLSNLLVLQDLRVSGRNTLTVWQDPLLKVHDAAKSLYPETSLLA